MALPEKNPFNEYKKTQITTANQGKLIVMLYDGAIKFLNIAIDNMDPKTYDVVNNNIIKAQDIITELLLSLNMKEGGEISQNLFNLYLYFKKALLEANIKKDAEMVRSVLKLIKDLRDAWDKISANETGSDKSTVGVKGSFSIEG
ncbi:MAG TPA: flagellar export chaperone FliS [Spirochaetota bacterium]|nr:flagellar export chaperone FliS [Spirochaetota bacterium]HOD16575.1 flagellar export chaperone FliS [Spirochaetota bacterium]HPG51945.1 flagellar export chaperone FliS [Spirochaetota bacterium]HPN11376.1 flagellar export chaperone FliS [Spirochaetota bacterium]HQL81127.1 flagellar export chaperone FliS [Spirochaetota bacterium]